MVAIPFNRRDARLVVFGTNTVDELVLDFPAAPFEFTSEYPSKVILDRGDISNFRMRRTNNPSVSGSYSFYYFTDELYEAISKGLINDVAIQTQYVTTAYPTILGGTNPVTNAPYLIGEFVIGRPNANQLDGRAPNNNGEDLNLYNLKYELYDPITGSIRQILFFFNCVTTSLTLSEGNPNVMAFTFQCLNDVFIWSAA